MNKLINPTIIKKLSKNLLDSMYDEDLEILLQKLLNLAKFLENDQLENFATSELKGYENDEVPKYRKTQARLRINLHNHFTMIQNQHISDYDEFFRDWYVTQPVSLLKSCLDGHALGMPVDSNFLHRIGIKSSGALISSGNIMIDDSNIKMILSQLRMEVIKYITDLCLGIDQIPEDIDEMKKLSQNISIGDIHIYGSKNVSNLVNINSEINSPLDKLLDDILVKIENDKNLSSEKRKLQDLIENIKHHKNNNIVRGALLNQLISFGTSISANIFTPQIVMLLENFL